VNGELAIVNGELAIVNGELAMKKFEDSTMKSTEHLWAVGYDEMERANQAREEIQRRAGSRLLARNSRTGSRSRMETPA